MTSLDASSVPAELLEAIDPQYETTWQKIVIAGQAYSFLVIDSPESLLDEGTLQKSHQELEIQPYWAQAWDSSYALAEYLFQLNELPKLELLEIGCGLGITGSVAASRGANVTMGDYAFPALAFAKINSWPWSDNVSVQLINWRSDTLNKKFDLIIGADVLYDRAEVPYINCFCRQHLVTGGKFLHADPHRAMTVEYINSLEDLGWQTTHSTFQSDSIGKPVRLVEFNID